MRTSYGMNSNVWLRRAELWFRKIRRLKDQPHAQEGHTPVLRRGGIIREDEAFSKFNIVGQAIAFND